MFVIINKRIAPTKTIFDKIKYLFAKKIIVTTLDFNEMGIYVCYEMLLCVNAKKSAKIKKRLADRIELSEISLVVCVQDEEMRGILAARGISVSDARNMFPVISEKLMAHLIEESGYRINECVVAISSNRINPFVRKAAASLARSVKELVLVTKDALAEELSEEIYDNYGASVVTVQDIVKRDDINHFLFFDRTKELLSGLNLTSQGYILNLDENCPLSRIRGYSIADGAKFKTSFPSLPENISENDFICALWMENKINPDDLEIEYLTVMDRPARIRKSGA